MFLLEYAQLLNCLINEKESDDIMAGGLGCRRWNRFGRIAPLDKAMGVIAMIFTRLFRLLAVPTIVLAVVTTLASLGGGREMGRMFKTAVTYTLLTTTAAAAVGLILYILIAPGNVPPELINAQNSSTVAPVELSYTDHLLSVVPDNVVKPFIEGNVLGLLVLCFAAGIAPVKDARF